MPRHNRYAFTLLELMITIAIIALLIAMIMPSLRSAREAAQLTLCLNNEKQHTLGSIMFATEHDDRLPWTNWDNGVLSEQGRGWLYDPAVGGDGNWQLEGGQLLDYIGIKDIWRCPMDDAAEGAVGVRQISSYVMNGAVSSFSRQPSFRSDQMRPDAVLYYELDENGPGGHWNDGANRPSEQITQRHNFGGTIARIDGSAEHVSLQQYFEMLEQTPGPLWCNPAASDGTFAD